MTEIAKVVAIDGEKIQVAPLNVDVCLACSNEKCRSQGSLFTVCNPQRLQITVGSEVRVAAPVVRQLFQGALALGVPVLAAILAYMLLPRCIPAVGDGLRAGLAVAVCVLVAVILTHFLSNSDGSFAEITEIL